jgi:DNA-binding GntR family transcriptional regulator
MDSEFLDRLAAQLKANKNPSCRRAIQRILELVKKDYESGGHNSTTEAEREFRRLVANDPTCK